MSAENVNALRACYDAFWKLRDGKVGRVEGYTDSARVLEALGR